MKKVIRNVLLLFMLILVTKEGWAADISSATLLKNALGNNAIEADGVVTLVGDVTIYESLQIVDGTMVLVVPKEWTLTIDGTSVSQDIIGINVNGIDANLTIKGGGKIIAKAKNGKDGESTSSPFGVPKAGEDGYSSRTIVLNKGKISLMSIDIQSTPGLGGKGGTYTGGVVPTYTKKDGNPGSAWPIDAEGSYTLGDMIPYGAYISIPVNVDYTIKGGGINLSEVTVSLSSYTAIYNADASTINMRSPYTLDTYTKPTGSRTGYTFDGLTPKTSGVTYVNGVPVLNTHSSEGSIEFDAKWTPTQYTIHYKDNADGLLPTGTYNIEEEVSSLASFPTRDNAIFDGWYSDKNCNNKVTCIPLGSTGDKTFYGQWLTKRTINYDCGDKEVNLPEGAITEFHKKTETFALPTNLTRTGYNFEGWLNKKEASGPIYTQVEKGTDQDLEFVASWTPKQYTAKFYLTEDAATSFEQETYTIESDDIFPNIEGKREHYQFTGEWKYKGSILQSLPYPDDEKTSIDIYAVWQPVAYQISFDVQTSEATTPSSTDYSVETDGLALPKNLKRNGYAFKGWYKDKDCTQSFGTTIPKGTSGNFTLYAKWDPIQYTIEYNTYSDVKVPSSTYTIEQEIALPVPQRDAYSFVGWYESDRLEGDAIMTIAKETTGNKKLYAKWSAGSRLNMSQAANGTFTVKNGDKEVKSGDYVGPKTKLTLTATPVSPYTLSKWVIDGKEAGSDNPTTVEMPATNGLAISAIFVDNRTAATAPDIITDPVNTERVPKGESVKVKLSNKDASATLYYSVDGATDKEYEGEFLVASHKDTLQIKAIARKSGFKDGVTTRQVIFDNSKITLTFNLPLGVKAVNPSGGEVVTATTTGGSFEFELKVDREYYTNLDSMVVSANDSVIKAGSAGLYTLTNCTSDVTITVAGLKAKVCNVTLQQTDNGTISFTEGAEETTMEVEYGASVSVTAKADEDFKFLQWSTGSQSNPLKLTVDKDTTISARFINDYKAYAITLPQLEGVTVRPFTGYSTEVKKDGTFKFYLKLADGYREENPVVRANGEVLAKNKGGYAIYKVNKNISISVEGIVRESVTMKVPGNVNAKVVETMSNASKQEVYEETMILLHAEAPAGKIFDKWTDGKTDNPRMVPAVDAEQLHPLFTNKGDAAYAKVILNQSPGAGITAVNANIDGVKTGETVQLNVVLLPAYSQSEVTLTVDGEVLKPSVSLRAASETKTYMYSLPVKKDEITVKVSGMKLNTYNVSLAQTDGGVVYSNPAGTATHGDKIQLKAQPEPGMLFVKWWDGNTLNPYPYTVTADTEVKASFLGAESTVDNESIRKDDPIEITTDGNRLSIKVDKEYQVYIYNFGGGLYQKRKIPAGGYSMYLPNGEYLIKVGDKVDKVIIR